MKTITKITITEDIALITLRNSPADMAYIAHVFKVIAEKDINVDMISQTAPLGGKTNLSFTARDENLGDILETFATLRAEYPEIKADIYGGNCKISLYGEAMQAVSGVAAEVFKTIADLNVDISIITTSEVDISILIPKADFHTVSEALEKSYGKEIFQIV